MNREEAVKLAKEFIETELPKKKWFLDVEQYIKAIIFYGSRAKETNRENSDLDLMIILPLEAEKKYTKGEYFYEFKGYEINIVLRSIEKLEKIDFAKDAVQREIFRSSTILFPSNPSNHISSLASYTC